MAASIDELYTDNDSGNGSISTNTLEDIWYGSQTHQGLNLRKFRLKIFNPVKQAQNVWKIA